MYVRWKRREKSAGKYSWNGPGRVALSAVLVKSERVNGRPRQKFIAYLGIIEEGRKTLYFHQREFWQSVDRHLAELQLSSELRDKIERDLIAVVERPTQEGLEKVLSELKTLEQRIEQRM
jgi:hypothetical protein